MNLDQVIDDLDALVVSHLAMYNTLQGLTSVATNTTIRYSTAPVNRTMEHYEVNALNRVLSDVFAGCGINDVTAFPKDATVGFVQESMLSMVTDVVKSAVTNVKQLLTRFGEVKQKLALWLDSNTRNLENEMRRIEHSNHAFITGSFDYYPAWLSVNGAPLSCADLTKQCNLLIGRLQNIDEFNQGYMSAAPLLATKLQNKDANLWELEREMQDLMRPLAGYTVKDLWFYNQYPSYTQTKSDEFSSHQIMLVGSQDVTSGSKWTIAVPSVAQLKQLHEAVIQLAVSTKAGLKRMDKAYSQYNTILNQTNMVLANKTLAENTPRLNALRAWWMSTYSVQCFILATRCHALKTLRAFIQYFGNIAELYNRGV